MNTHGTLKNKQTGQEITGTVAGKWVPEHSTTFRIDGCAYDNGIKTDEWDWTPDAPPQTRVEAIQALGVGTALDPNEHDVPWRNSTSYTYIKVSDTEVIQVYVGKTSGRKVTAIKINAEAFGTGIVNPGEEFPFVIEVEYA